MKASAPELASHVPWDKIPKFGEGWINGSKAGWLQSFWGNKLKGCYNSMWKWLSAWGCVCFPFFVEGLVDGPFFPDEKEGTGGLAGGICWWTIRAVLWTKTEGVSGRVLIVQGFLHFLKDCPKKATINSLMFWWELNLHYHRVDLWVARSLSICIYGMEPDGRNLIVKSASHRHGDEQIHR